MLKEKLADDLKEAMRARDDVRRRTLRSLRAALMEKEIAGREGKDTTLTEQEELNVLQKQAKQRRDSMQQYDEYGRDDLAERERAELDVIESYLPDRLTDEDLDRILHDIVEDTGASSMGDMGSVMGEAMKRLRGRAQGGRVRQRVQKILSE
jgi:uncharacterized protein YqeY